MHINQTILQQMIAEGFVTIQKHPAQELFIYNYSQKAQYDKVWNEITLQCRGLILDAQGKIIARPFKKFFNLGEQENQTIPQEAFEVYEKLDGSLGILYWINDEPFIATRGSFTSDQAIKASEILKRKYRHVTDRLHKNKTYLFEIIYPENRIVVDYGQQKDLILLAIIDTETGIEQPLHDVGFPIVKKYDGINDIWSLSAIEEKNKEGFVILFASGLRYKVKFKEYVRIHRIVTQVSNISIWDYLREGKSLDELIERVPDEFFSWVKKINNELLQSFKTIEEKAKSEYKVLEDRKTTALYFQQCTYPAVLFAMLTGKDYKKIIWKMLKPTFSKPFSNMEK